MNRLGLAADTNGAWQALLGDCPLGVFRDRVEVFDRTIEGEDLACVLTYPRPDSDRALVAVVAGTGLIGSRLTDRLPYFVSGVQYPDWTVLDPEMLSRGIEGVRAAGFFGSDWDLETGETEWREGFLRE